MLCQETTISCCDYNYHKVFDDLRAPRCVYININTLLSFQINTSMNLKPVATASLAFAAMLAAHSGTVYMPLSTLAVLPA